MLMILYQISFVLSDRDHDVNSKIYSSIYHTRHNDGPIKQQP